MLAEAISSGLILAALLRGRNHLVDQRRRVRALEYFFSDPPFHRPPGRHEYAIRAMGPALRGPWHLAVRQLCRGCAYPNFCPEWAEGCFHLITNVFRPLLLGQEINSAQELQDSLGPFKSNHFAKAAIDLAWWDLSTRMQDRPLWQAIGGLDTTIAVGADIPVQPGRARLLNAVCCLTEASGIYGIIQDLAGFREMCCSSGFFHDLTGKSGLGRLDGR